MYPSEYYMRKAMLAAEKNQGTLVYDYQARAINANTRRDVYHNAYAQTSLALAQVLATKSSTVTETEQETIKNLLSEAVRSTRATTEILEPVNVTNWEIRAELAKALMGVASDASQSAKMALNTAIQLDPANPRLRLDLGGIYYAEGDYLSAANMFRQATNLKSNYANAYYNFGQALLNLEDYANATKAFETVQKLVPENSTDAKIIANELQKLAEMPAVAGAATDKPSVEDLAGQDTATIVPQEPLINKGEETIKESTQSEGIVE